MDKNLIRAYKEHYFKEMSKYDYNFCTAFPLVKVYMDATGKYKKRALSPSNAKSFIHKNLLHPIKHDLLVRDESNRLKRGVPFYAYYVICKEEMDIHYHAHVLLNVQERYWEYVKYYIELLTDREMIRLKTKRDQVRMIIYMLMKGNLVIDSDNEYLIPTGYNLKVNKDHFTRYN